MVKSFRSPLQAGFFVPVIIQHVDLKVYLDASLSGLGLNNVYFLV